MLGISHPPPLPGLPLEAAALIASAQVQAQQGAALPPRAPMRGREEDWASAWDSPGRQRQTLSRREWAGEAAAAATATSTALQAMLADGRLAAAIGRQDERSFVALEAQRRGADERALRRALAGVVDVFEQAVFRFECGGALAQPGEILQVWSDMAANITSPLASRFTFRSASGVRVTGAGIPAQERAALASSMASVFRTCLWSPSVVNMAWAGTLQSAQTRLLAAASGEGTLGAPSVASSRNGTAATDLRAVSADPVVRANRERFADSWRLEADAADGWGAGALDAIAAAGRAPERSLWGWWGEALGLGEVSRAVGAALGHSSASPEVDFEVWAAHHADPRVDSRAAGSAAARGAARDSLLRELSAVVGSWPVRPTVMNQRVERGVEALGAGTATTEAARLLVGAWDLTVCRTSATTRAHEAAEKWLAAWRKMCGTGSSDSTLELWVGVDLAGKCLQSWTTADDLLRGDTLEDLWRQWARIVRPSLLEMLAAGELHTVAGELRATARDASAALARLVLGLTLVKLTLLPAVARAQSLSQLTRRQALRRRLFEWVTSSYVAIGIPSTMHGTTLAELGTVLDRAAAADGTEASAVAPAAGTLTAAA